MPLTPRDLMSTRQHDAIHRQICNRFSNYLGHEVRSVPFWVHNVKSLSGIRWVDLQAGLEGTNADFHVLIPNRYASLNLGDGFRTGPRQ